MRLQLAGGRRKSSAVAAALEAVSSTSRSSEGRAKLAMVTAGGRTVRELRMRCRSAALLAGSRTKPGLPEKRFLVEKTGARFVTGKRR